MTPPCKKHGIDCPLRRAGCQARCEKYKAFRAERMAQYEKNAMDVRIGDVISASFTKNNRKH